jgi:hypothetical protein
MTLHRALTACFVAVATVPAVAQPGSVEPGTDWIFGASAARPGTTIRAAVEIRFPGKFHVQSNKPLDEFLIPTILTVTPPAGLAVREVV